MNAFDDILGSAGRGDRVRNVDASDDEHIVFELDLSDGVRRGLLDVDLARCQRAGKSSGQSTRSRGEDERSSIFELIENEAGDVTGISPLARALDARS